MHNILTTHDILLTCGTGGVGKTTIAAALGLASAKLGQRTLVVTIDPARRLADALGLEEFGQDIVPIWPEHEEDAAHGLLDGMMLDAKNTFDTIIERYAPDPATAERIMDNPLYRELSALITGSQEYMAMETLYALKHDFDYDLIILDTPPSQHALDFFRAPLRLTNALQDSMLKLFLKPSLVAGKLGAKLLGVGSQVFMKAFGKLTGAEMLQEISDLLNSSVGLFDGFGKRATAVQEMLHANSTGIIAVTSPTEHRIDDMVHFIRQAGEEGMHIVATLFNRCLPAALGTPAKPLRDCGEFEDIARQLESNHATCMARSEHESQQMQRCTSILGEASMVQRIDDQAKGLLNFHDMWQLVATLTPQPAAPHSQSAP